MQELTNQELYQALAYAKSIDEDTGRKMLEQFQLDQTALAQTIFGVFPALVAKENQDMSYLFMDLCFDVLCIFQKAFGPLPPQNEMDFDWAAKQAVLMDAELQSLIQENPMDDKLRAKLQDRFTKRAFEDSPQMGLVKLMNEAIDDYASESPSRVSAIKPTQTMIAVVIRLFDNLYTQASGKAL
ncbi:hypothetical protein [Methylobacter sp. BlB1]|jgi:hypothetical protein|uniref:hypothetical protein n=1 Tax=unclassified Methylobacter TaxID=2635283 RepID=UPI0018947E28|nr:hypothetical protein [Methylobacter sp. BlB1]MBF6650811.1 hypothetical protein [Methylobacter sp. BlB1]